MLYRVFSVEKATLESQMSVCTSVCPSVTESPQPLRIAPISHRAYQPLSLKSIRKKMMLREDDPPSNQAEIYAQIW